MTRLISAVIVILAVLAGSAHADEPTPLKWPEQYKTLALRISDAAVISAIAVDTWDSFHAEDRREAFTCQAARMGVSAGVNVLVKNLFHRDRPDHSNHFSFYSGHTSNAWAAHGWRFAVVAGYGRAAAHRHYLTDVGVGALAGWLSSKVCGGDDD